jgi:hypothetical protein
LDYLTEGFIAHGYDMKWLHREIATSQTYQRTWRTNDTNRHDNRNFSHATVRRLPAEVLLDAMAQATAAPADLRRFARLVDERAIGPKGGPGMRRTGGGSEYAMKVFGRSTRETNCDCSRTDAPNLLQSIFLQNDQEVLAAIERNGGWQAATRTALGRSRGAESPKQSENNAVKAAARRVAALETRLGSLREDDDEDQERSLRRKLTQARAELRTLRENPSRSEGDHQPAAGQLEAMAREAYLRTLNRHPSAQETEIAREHLASATDPANGLRDLLWALLNTKEFITNH